MICEGAAGAQSSGCGAAKWFHHAGRTPRRAAANSKYTRTSPTPRLSLSERSVSFYQECQICSGAAISLTMTHARPRDAQPAAQWCENTPLVTLCHCVLREAVLEYSSCCGSICELNKTWILKDESNILTQNSDLEITIVIKYRVFINVQLIES